MLKARLLLKLMFLFFSFFFYNSVCAQTTLQENIINIDSHPRGAQICINDNFCGTTPYTAVNIGSREIRIKLTLNDKTRETNINYFKGRYDLFMVMDGDYGLLNLTTAPDSMEVYVDSVLVGITPLTDMQVKQGIHKLTIKKDDYETIEKEVFIKPSRYDYKFNSEFNSCLVTVNNERIVNMKVDNVDARNAGGSDYKLTKGYHTINLIASDYDGAFEAGFTFDNRQHYDLHVRYNYFSPKYLVYSALIPGLGQFIDKSKLKGIGFLISTLAGAAVYFSASSKYNSLMPDYEREKNSYYNAKNTTSASKARQLLEPIIDEINKYSRIKRFSLGFTAGAYLLNIVDAFLYHSKGSSIELVRRIETGPGPQLKINLN